MYLLGITRESFKMYLFEQYFFDNNHGMHINNGIGTNDRKELNMEAKNIINNENQKGLVGEALGLLTPWPELLTLSSEWQW